MGIRRDINTLIEHCFPDVARALHVQYGQELHSVRISDALLGKLDAMFERCQGDRMDQPITLQELTDCFLIHFEKSTIQFPPRPYDSQTTPPVSQYIELLKCQFIMQRVKSYDKLQNMPRMSHWPGYVAALEEVSRLFLSAIVIAC